MGGGHDEREQTLNQLLVEMDGFGINEGIIVMAATNRVDILDPAILRPGRFDRKVAVGRPDVKGREEILKVHSKEKPLGEDVDLHRVAQTTSGFTGADLENLMNEAAILSARENRRFIRQNDIDRAFVKVGIGAEKGARLFPKRIKRSQLTMRQVTRSCSMCFRMWGRFIRFPLSLPVWGLQATPCLFRKRMRCSTPEAVCFRASWWIWADALQRS